LGNYPRVRGAWGTCCRSKVPARPTRCSVRRTRRRAAVLDSRNSSGVRRTGCGAETTCISRVPRASSSSIRRVQTMPGPGERASTRAPGIAPAAVQASRTRTNHFVRAEPLGTTCSLSVSSTVSRGGCRSRDAPDVLIRGGSSPRARPRALRSCRARVLWAARLGRTAAPRVFRAGSRETALEDR